MLPRVRRAVEDGHRHVLLNLTHVSYVDSTGIGEIVGAYTRVVREGGSLKLFGLSAQNTGAARYDEHRHDHRLVSRRGVGAEVV